MHEPRATAHIPLMIALVEQLVAKGLAYAVPDGSVYFRVRRFPAYGKLSHRRLEDMEAGEEIDPAKEDVHDFALWKGAKPGEPTWESPWGRGRPGWHLECSAMAAHYLGQPFDVHGGAPLDFGPGRLEEAARSLERLYESLARADEALGALPAVAPAGALSDTASGFLADFTAAMDDDLNAAKALGFVYDRVREMNR